MRLHCVSGNCSSNGLGKSWWSKEVSLRLVCVGLPAGAPRAKSISIIPQPGWDATGPDRAGVTYRGSRPGLPGTMLGRLDSNQERTEPRAMRILMVTSFPIPGEYDGTAMLPIKILRALKPRGVDVVVAHLRLQAGRGPGQLARATSRGRRLHAAAGRLGHGRAAGGSPASSRSTWSTPSITAARRGPISPAGGTAGRWSTRSTRCWATRSSATAWAGGSSSGLPGASSARSAGTPRQIIALGEPVKQVVVEEKGVPADRVSVIYPGIDLAEYDAARPAGRRSRASGPSTRWSCTSAASSTPTRACRS